MLKLIGNLCLHPVIRGLFHDLHNTNQFVRKRNINPEESKEVMKYQR